MTNNFSKYAEYYNLVYHQKNYLGEVNFIDNLIKKNRPTSKTICDLGCGTGNYSIYLARKGYFVTGLDLSKDMIQIAKKNEQVGLKFVEGNIIDFTLSENFDVIVAMFDVISYITSNDDFIKMLINIKNHINKGGLFIFDFWYGPGVLTDLPQIRYKEFRNDNFLIKRVSNPIVNYSSSVVDVEFDLFVFSPKNEFIEYIKEIHKMRYFFKNELEHLIKSVFPSCVIDYAAWENVQESEKPWHLIGIIKT